MPNNCNLNINEIFFLYSPDRLSKKGILFRVKIKVLKFGKAATESMC